MPSGSALTETLDASFGEEYRGNFDRLSCARRGGSWNGRVSFGFGMVRCSSGKLSPAPSTCPLETDARGPAGPGAWSPPPPSSCSPDARSCSTGSPPASDNSLAALSGSGSGPSLGSGGRGGGVVSGRAAAADAGSGSTSVLRRGTGPASPPGGPSRPSRSPFRARLSPHPMPPLWRALVTFWVSAGPQVTCREAVVR